MKQSGALIMVLAVIAAVFGSVGPGPGAPPAPTAAGPARTGPDPGRAAFTPEGITIVRDATGQFHLDAAANGAPTRFLVDTGADTVALTEADAERAGLVVDPATFRPILRTASGQGFGAPARLDRLEIGGTELRDVEAVVVKDLGTSLLGQSALRRLGRVEQSGDRMVLEPRG